MKQILYRLFEHQYLGKEEAREILQNMVAGKYTDTQIASLITVFLMRNISVEELAGFTDALLEMRVPVDLAEYKPLDIVGTGGDGKNTFNISTTSCLTARCSCILQIAFCATKKEPALTSSFLKSIHSVFQNPAIVFPCLLFEEIRNLDRLLFYIA